MAALHQEPETCLGFDVAKDTIAVSDGTRVDTLANTVRAIRAYLKRARPGLAVCEPTGGHERLLLDECLRAGVPVHRSDTLKVKAFIRSFGTLGKSDAIDAVKLAAYGRERWRQLSLWQPPDKPVQQLKDLVRRRQDLIAMRVAETNRAKAPGITGALKASVRAILAALKKQIVFIDTEIADLVRHTPALASRQEVCMQMKGIGATTAAALLAAMPELGTLSRRQAAALAGLAPHPNESGLKKGYRRTRGGRPEIASLLFMPALAPTRTNSPFSGFYQKLIAAGKKPMLAITAVMRKIIVALNARLREHAMKQS